MFWGKLNQSASAQASKSVADKVTQLKAHNNQPTTNIFLICYPWNEKVNSHTILNSDALSTDDALSR